MTHNSTQIFDGIVIFVQVVKRGHFGEAAQDLGHSASYVSKAINQLEARLGVRLLNRTTRAIALTPEGERYYHACLEMLSLAESATEDVSTHQTIPKGRLKVGCPVGMGLRHVQTVFARYLQLYPEVSLDLVVSDQISDIVAEGFDVMIRATANLPDSSLIARRLYQCPIYTVASPQYLSQHGAPKHPSELVEHATVCYSHLNRMDHWTFIDDQNRRDTYLVHPKVRCNFSTMSLEMVKAGLVIGRFPAFYVEEDLMRGELVSLLPEWGGETVTLYAIYPSRQQMPLKVRCFLDELIAYFEGLETHVSALQLHTY